MDFRLSQEQEMFVESIRNWVDREAPKDWVRELERHEDEFPFELWDKMSAAGFHGVSIPEDYGGQGGTIVDQVLLARGLARSLSGLAWVWGITSFAGGKSVGLYGTEQQKRRILPLVAKGEARWSISFTEAGGGTDVVGGLRTTARKVDGGWLLNGAKTWCTGAHVADYILLLARTDGDPSSRYRGLSLFIVPGDAEGLTTSQIPKLGIRCIGSSDIALHDVFVNDDGLLGEPGRAWHMLLPTLNNERIVMAALCCGILDGVLEDALWYVGERSAFGRPIGSFQTIQQYIADIAMWRKQVELLVYDAASRQSEGLDCMREATYAKVVGSEYATKAADLGIQIFGGMGYSAEVDMQRYWRDARLFRLAPITNEMARNIVAESFGLPRSF